MAISVEKLFANFPAAHRQPAHKGHCRYLHGHNWAFKLTFYNPNRSANPTGFVIDFGGKLMKGLKALLEYYFDHTLLITHNDPSADFFKKLVTEEPDIFGTVRFIKDSSCEGIAEFVLALANSYFLEAGCSVKVIAVQVFEDDKNSATVLDPHPPASLSLDPEITSHVVRHLSDLGLLSAGSKAV